VAAQEAGAQQVDRGLRLLAHGLPRVLLRRRAGALDRARRLLDVDPDRLGQGDAQALLALEGYRLERASEAREHGAKAGLRVARRALGPEHGDQLVALHAALAVGQQVAEQGVGLAAGQRARQVVSVDLERELPAEPDRGRRRDDGFGVSGARHGVCRV
jgi:hypothetical protein